MTASLQKSTGLMLVLFIGLVAMHLAHMQVIHSIPYEFKFEKQRLILKAEHCKAVSLGFSRLNADLNWLGFVQYYGDRRSAIEDRYKYAPAFLRLVIDLDPNFLAPYWFASFILAGELDQVKEASEILDIGIKNNPKNWVLYYIAGFNQYMYGYDKKLANKRVNTLTPAESEARAKAVRQRFESEERAAQYYELGSKQPDAPGWLLGFAKIMRSHNLGIIREIQGWEQILKTTSSGAVREKALESIQSLWSQVYYSAPSDAYRQRAQTELAKFDLPLLDRKQVSQEIIPEDQLKKLAN